MQNLRRYFSLFLFCILLSVHISNAQQLRAVMESNGHSIQGEVYRKLLNCSGARVFVPDDPKFQREGIQVYPSAFDQLIFVERNQSIYCATIGFGWHLDGFVDGTLNSAPEKPLSLFKISGEGVDRYFDFRGKREVYPITGAADKLVVSDSIPERPGKRVNIIESWHGPDSRIAETEYKRIVSNVEWKRFWKTHDTKKQPLPKIDFSKNMVIAVCSGRAYNISGVEAVDVREAGDSILFRFHYLSYQTMDRIDTVTPFGIFVLPRSNKKTQLEVKVQHLIGGPAKWKLVAEFEKLD
jgi:hypothetical protein